VTCSYPFHSPTRKKLRSCIHSESIFMLVRFPSACMRVSEHLRSSFRGTGVAIGEGNSAEYSVSFCVMLVLDIRDCCTRHRRPGQTLHAPRPAVPVPTCRAPQPGTTDGPIKRTAAIWITRTCVRGARDSPRQPEPSRPGRDPTPRRNLFSSFRPLINFPSDGRIPSLAARHV
jgi:hypothetical protein